MSKTSLLIVVAALALCHGAHIFTDSSCDTGYALGESADQVDCLIGRLNNDTAVECSEGCAVSYSEECTSGYTIIDKTTSETSCWFGSEGSSINNYYDSTEIDCGTGCEVIGDTDCGGGYAFSNGDESACVDVYTRDDTAEAMWWLKTNPVSFVPHEVKTEHDEKVLEAAAVKAAAVKTAAVKTAELAQRQRPEDSSQGGKNWNEVKREAEIYLNYKTKDDARKAAKAAAKATAEDEDVTAAAAEEDEKEDAALLEVASRVHKAEQKDKDVDQHAASKALDEKDEKDGKTEAKKAKKGKATKKKSRTAMNLKKKLQQKQLQK